MASCQSCGITIMSKEEFGKEKNGVLKVDYCRYCYDKGTFIEPEITFERMVEKVAAAMKTNRNVSDEAARESATRLLTGLKRWQASH